MEAFEAWWRAKFPGEAEKWDDPLYAGTEWREKHLRFLREVRREAWDAGIEWERSRRARCLANAPNLERLREMEDLLKVGADETATPNVKVSGPEAALSPEGRARLPGCAPAMATEKAMDDKQADQLAGLAMSCALACVSGQKTVTVSTRGQRPKGFPRGELLSVGSDGAKNYACDPVKVLAWLHSRTKGHNVGIQRLRSSPLE